jgi:hypothetical protein
MMRAKVGCGRRQLNQSSLTFAAAGVRKTIKIAPTRVFFPTAWDQEDERKRGGGRGRKEEGGWGGGGRRWWWWRRRRRRRRRRRIDLMIFSLYPQKGLFKSQSHDSVLTIFLLLCGKNKSG